MVEHDLAARHHELRRAGSVGDLGRDVEQAEHALHADDGVADLAIGEAQHVERHVELQQEGVHGHEIAERHRALNDALARHQHHHGEAAGDDGALAYVEQRQRAAGTDRRRLVAPAADIVAARLMLFVAEVLHRLVVQQAVDRLGVGLGVGVVHATDELDAPFRQHDREQDVACDDAQRHRREAPVVEPPQDDGDQGNLEQRRQDVESGEADQELHALGAALDDAAQSAGLALEMEAKAECMEMTEHFEREVADRPLRHRREDRIAHLAEGLRQHARQAIGKDQRDRHRHSLRLAVAQGIDGVLVEERHIDVDHFGQDQQHERDKDAAAQPPLILRPQMAAENAQHGSRTAHADAGWTIGLRGRHFRSLVALGAWAFYRA